MTDRDQDATMIALAHWSNRLTAALGIQGLDVDIDAVLTLAGTAAHEILRPAAPLTTYLVGFAAGMAATSSQNSGAIERGDFDRAAAIATSLAKSGHSDL